MPPHQVLLPCVLAGLIPAQAPVESAPKDPFAAADAVFADLDKTTSPGCALAVFREGRIVYARGYGMADLEREVTITPRSVFDIASTSKQFVAFCILLLENDGLLSLDDDIRKHLPAMPDYGRPITIRHLVHHTSGIRDYLVLMMLAGMPFAHDYPEQQIVELIARQKALNFEPGTEHLYSNSGYFLLSEIIHRVSSRTTGVFARERIFEPLGMRSTQFYDDFRRVVKNRAIGYVPDEDGGYATELYLFDLVGDGGVLTTVEDLLLWDRNFYDNELGGGAELIQRMLEPGRLENGKTLDYACGLGVSSHRGLRMVSHSGSWAGYRSDLIRFPEHELSVAVLSNLGTFDPTSAALEVAGILLGERMTAEATARAEAGDTPEKSVELSAEEMAAMTGTYRNVDSGRTWRLSVDGDKLRVKVASGQEFELVPTDRRTLRAVDAPVPIVLRFGDEGKVAVLIADRPARSYERIELARPDADALKEFAGGYRSDELLATYRIAVGTDGTNLTVGIGYDPETMVLEPTTGDEFGSAFCVVRFERDAEGRITGARISAGRVRDIGFSRVE